MLDPTPPSEAVELYLADREGDVAASTHKRHQERLKRFLEWCDETGFENMNEITGKKLMQYKQWRKDAGLATVTLKNQLWTLRVFLRFCEGIDAVPEGISEKMRMPTVDVGEDTRDTLVTAEEAEEILAYCEKYEYASLRHITFHLLWHTGIRSGTTRALDISDYHATEQYLDVTHRPSTGTPLKNKERGERQIALKAKLCEVLDDYIDMHHPMVEDDHGRVPLLGTDHGRTNRTTIQSQIYTLTRPCHYTNECPHDRDPQDCEATNHSAASQCPSSLSPHAIRRGSITYHRRVEIPKDVASERMNVSTEVLDKHYDRRTKKEQREARQKYLDDL
jgi:site-specific recombinase XerD